MKDQHLITDDEPVKSLDDLNAAAANKWLVEVERTIAEDARDYAAEGGNGPRLISVDELRAAGALDVPAAWRKSLGGEPDLFSELLEDDSSGPNKRRRLEVDTGDESTAGGDS